MDGFTTVRDMGGPTFGLQRNIDAGVVLGPRLYPSGSFISQTSGHGDFHHWCHHWCQTWLSLLTYLLPFSN